MTAAPAGGGLGVLSAIDDALRRLHAAHNAAAGKQREVVAEEHGNLTEARIAIAELIEAARDLRRTKPTYSIAYGQAEARLDAALAKVASNGGEG